VYSCLSSARDKISTSPHLLPNSPCTRHECSDQPHQWQWQWCTSHQGARPMSGDMRTSRCALTPSHCHAIQVSHVPHCCFHSSGGACGVVSSVEVGRRENQVALMSLDKLDRLMLGIIAQWWSEFRTGYIAPLPPVLEPYVHHVRCEVMGEEHEAVAEVKSAQADITIRYYTLTTGEEESQRHTHLYAAPRLHVRRCLHRGVVSSAI
jgi:hypothetical protein